MRRTPKDRGLIVLALALAVAASAACQPKQPPAPAKKQAEGTGLGSDALRRQDREREEERRRERERERDRDRDRERRDDERGGAGRELAIEPEREADLRELKEGREARLRFRIVNAGGKRVGLGLFATPEGARLEKDGTAVVLTWPRPRTGAQSVRFLLRDLGRCEEVERAAERCRIDPEDYGRLSKQAYDVLSKTFALEVEKNPAADPDQIGVGTGGGGAGGGGRDDLIKQILALLGGSGDPSSLLDGLTDGQLKDVLTILKNGGGGFDLATILKIIGAARGHEVPVEDPAAVREAPSR